MLRRKALELFLRSVEKIRVGSLDLELSDGRNYRFEGPEPGPQAHMRLLSEDVLLYMLCGGDIACAATYRAGKWETRDLPSLIECGLRNQIIVNRFIFGSSLFKKLVWLSYSLRTNSRQGSRRNIHAHYDLGNSFYTLWLDSSMTYSSALFQEAGESLEQAQQNKYARILEIIDAGPRMLLDIGCGWGGFAESALEHGVERMHGITISAAQHHYASQRLQKYGQRSEIRIQDYRDVNERYDAIVSIEMFEAIGKKYWSTYFQKIRSLLTANGVALIQAITIDENYFDRYSKNGDIIRSYIFPGGMLPSLPRFANALQISGLQMVDRLNFGMDYARTLQCWLQRFDMAREQILALGYDESFIRLWRFYLASCIAGFRSGRTDVMQVELRHA